MVVETQPQKLRLESIALTQQNNRPNTDASALSSWETDLVAKLQARDSAAFKELVDCYAELLLKIGARLTGSRVDAEDIVQETFEGALASLGRFEGRSSLKSWLISILYRRAARHYKKQRRIQVKKTEVLRLKSGTEAHVAGSAETTLDIEIMLESLSEEHRAVVVLKEFEGLTYQEIADALDIPRGTVESRMYRARNALRRDFREYFDPKPSVNKTGELGGDSQ